MATKKQKRAAALKKRESYLEEVRQEGLEAQRRSQAEYQEQLRVSIQRNREMKQRVDAHSRRLNEEQYARWCYWMYVLSLTEPDKKDVDGTR